MPYSTCCVSSEAFGALRVWEESCQGGSGMESTRSSRAAAIVSSASTKPACCRKKITGTSFWMFRIGSYFWCGIMERATDYERNSLGQSQVRGWFVGQRSFSNLAFWRFLIVTVSLLSCSTFAVVAAQQPTQTPAPQRPGRSYSTGDLPKTQPPPGPRAPSPVTFNDITALARIDFKHAASATSMKYLLETMGGGVAILDYDNDGRMDLFFTNGALLNDSMSK